jgi:N-acyl-D-amino-acid deacylase
MEAGAVGLCVGLDYQPSVHSDTHEQAELAAVAREFGGIYAAHGRSIEFGRIGAFRETMEVSRRARIPVCVSHEKVDAEVTALLDEAAADPDVDLTTESHLYSAGSTHLLYNVPLADQVGGPEAVLERLEAPGYRAALAARLDESFSGVTAAGLNAYFSASRTGRHIGRTIAEIADAWHLGPGDATVRLLREELPDAMLIYPWGETEEEFEITAIASVRHPAVIVSSDGVYHGPLPHPRGFGTFPRVLRRFVRELGAVTLEQAIWKMSGLPASRYGLRDRGRIEVGRAADLVIFDPATVADRATYAEPRLVPVGIDRVIVNGVTAARDGRATGLRPGRVLRSHPA